MKKNHAIPLIFLVCAALASCNPQASVRAGDATGAAMLQLLPASVRGVFVVNVHRALGTDAAAKVLKDEKAKEKYDAFVKMAGLDPMKDIYFLVVGITGTPTGLEHHEGAAIINLKYNKDQLLAKLKEVAKDVQEETYNGVTIYKGAEPGKHGSSPVGAFLDDSNVVVGNDKVVRAVIDVSQKKAESVLKNSEMAKILKSVNKSAIVWAAFAIPPDLVKMAVEKNPMAKALEGITALTMSFDYVNRDLVTQIESLGGTKEQNEQLANMLNGLKAMGATAASEQPVWRDLLNTLEISSGADHVKIFASIPGELLDKAQELAKEKLGGLTQAGPRGPKEEKPQEKKEAPKIKK
jgi:hypothetical protein